MHIEDDEYKYLENNGYYNLMDDRQLTVYLVKRILTIVLLWMMIFILFGVLSSLVYLIRSNPTPEELLNQIFYYMPVFVLCLFIMNRMNLGRML